MNSSMNEKNIHLLEPISYHNNAKIFDLKFNPMNNDLGVVDVSGKLRILKVDQETKEIVKVKNFKVSEESIYSLDYSHDGESILCGTSEGELVLINGSKIQMRKKKAHETTINKVKFINENLFASADLTGEIKIFDLRTKYEIYQFKEQEEEITEFEYSPNHSLLLSTSIDGTLGVYDIRKEGKYKLYALSDCLEDELYCMKIVKNGQKVACGTSEGPIVLFNWNWFGDLKDRIMGHPGSVNTLEKYDENFLISGCEDGGIRFVSVTPKFLHSLITDKTVTKGNKNKIFNDVNVISLDKDRRFLAVNTNIEYIKFYDISDIKLEKKDNFGEENEEMNEVEEEDIVSNEEDSDGEEGEEDNEMSDSAEDDEEKLNLEIGNTVVNENENEVDIDKDSDSDNEDDSDSASSVDKKKTDKSLKLTKNENSRTMIEKERRKDFFTNM